MKREKRTPSRWAIILKKRKEIWRNGSSVPRRPRKRRGFQISGSRVVPPADRRVVEPAGQNGVHPGAGGGAAPERPNRPRTSGVAGCAGRGIFHDPARAKTGTRRGGKILTWLSSPGFLIHPIPAEHLDFADDPRFPSLSTGHFHRPKKTVSYAVSRVRSSAQKVNHP